MKRVQVYFNLHKKVWSIRDAKTRKVISHSQILELADCTFHVSEAGRQRVLKEKRKNVHAWVAGTLCDDLVKWKKPRQVRYNPYKQATFTCDGAPIFEAPRVRLNADRTVYIQ